MRNRNASYLAWSLALVSACAGSDPSAPSAGLAGSGSSGAGSGASGSGGASAAAGAGPSAGAAGASVGSAGTPAPNAGVGGGDSGKLFEPGTEVPIVAAGGSASVDTGEGNTATIRLGGEANGTAVFSQKNGDVTVVVTLTRCPPGTLGIRIHDGFSCDNDGTMGAPWERGELADSGDSTIACHDNRASLTYVRLGTSAKKWTVATGDAKTDPTTHVLLVRANAEANSKRLVCANSF